MELPADDGGMEMGTGIGMWLYCGVETSGADPSYRTGGWSTDKGGRYTQIDRKLYMVRIRYNNICMQ